MLTDEEYLELVAAITKPVDVPQLSNMSISDAMAYNRAEAYRAAKALLKFYAYKRNQDARHNKTN